MALHLDVERARSFGCWAYYDSPADLLIPNPERPGETTVNVSYIAHELHELPYNLLHPQQTMARLGLPMSGWGWDWNLIPSLIIPGVVVCCFYMIIRFRCREPLSRFGIYMGVATPEAHLIAQGKRGAAALSRRGQKKVFKFQNQLWLAFYYTLSSLVGYVILKDFAWFTFPLDRKAVLDVLLPYPYNPPLSLMLYYYHGFGFYLAEMISLLVMEKHVKRSDFAEYLAHHCATMWLMMASHVSWDHRLGSYVLFLHDVSDILLCVTKVVHYMIEADDDREEAFNKIHAAKKDGMRYEKPFLFKYILFWFTEDALVAALMIVFFFFRMYCLPMVGQATLVMGPYLRHGNWTLYSLLIVLSVGLQLLNAYWSFLLIALAVRCTLLGAPRRDIRSESDEEETADILDAQAALAPLPSNSSSGSAPTVPSQAACHPSEKTAVPPKERCPRLTETTLPAKKDKQRHTVISLNAAKVEENGEEEAGPDSSASFTLSSPSQAASHSHSGSEDGSTDAATTHRHTPSGGLRSGTLRQRRGHEEALMEAATAHGVKDLLAAKKDL